MDLEYTLGEGPGGTRPRYGPAVADLGVHSVASAPLRRGSHHLGAVTAFDAPAENRLGELAGVLLLPEYNFGLPLVAEADAQAVVHQAAGMIAAQHECGVDDALALIRAHAFASNRGTEHVAARIVGRELRLD